MYKVLEEAMEYVEAKANASRDLSSVVKQIKEITHYDSEDIHLYKDVIHYKGLGWTETPITKPDPTVDFKDRVSPCFRKLSEIVRVCKEFGNIGILNDYIEAMKEVGIDITIRDIPDNKRVYDDTLNLVNEMDRLQTVICKNANELRDMGEEAEQENFCPKSKFKDLAESKYRLEKNASVEDGLHKLFAENLFHNKGISAILGEEVEEEESED